MRKMRKIYYVILCWIENLKSWLHWKSCNVPYNETYVLCELVNLREALHLMNESFDPAEVDYHSSGEHDSFYFRRSAALWMELDAYRKTIRTTVNAMNYDDLTAVCAIPGGQISPIDDAALENVIAPRGHVREAFAYTSWPVETRQGYIAANAETRRRMVDEAYQRG